MVPGIQAEVQSEGFKKFEAGGGYDKTRVV